MAVIGKSNKGLLMHRGKTIVGNKRILSEDPSEPKRTMKKSSKKNLHNYIFRVFRRESNQRISKAAVNVLNSFLEDVFERLGSECMRLVLHTKSHTMTGNDLSAALRLLFPGELGKHALNEGSSALTRYSHAMKKRAEMATKPTAAGEDRADTGGGGESMQDEGEEEEEDEEEEEQEEEEDEDDADQEEEDEDDEGDEDEDQNVKAAPVKMDSRKQQKSSR